MMKMTYWLQLSFCCITLYLIYTLARVINIHVDALQLFKNYKNYKIISEAQSSWLASVRYVVYIILETSMMILLSNSIVENCFKFGLNCIQD